MPSITSTSLPSSGSSRSFLMRTTPDAVTLPYGTLEMKSTLARQPAAVLLAVDQDDKVVDDEPRFLEHLDCLELAAAVRDDVIDQDHAIAGREDAFDAALGAVALLFLAGVDQRQVPREGGRDRQRQSRIGNAGNAVARAAAHLGGHEHADPPQHVRVADHHAEVDVKGRLDPGLEGELAEADGPDLEEAVDQHRVLGVRGHARISARTAAAAQAGSGPPVIGRPTTR